MSELTIPQKELHDVLSRVQKPAVALALIKCLVLSEEKIDLIKSIKKVKNKLKKDKRFSLSLLFTLHHILCIADSPELQIWKLPKSAISARVILDQFYTDLTNLIQTNDPIEKQ